MKIPRLKKGDAIEIEWIDAHFRSDPGWCDEEEFIDAEPVVIKSVCQYVSRDRDYINTVSDRSGTDPVGVMRDLRIPKGCIVSLRKL